jgi:hypothetical protein
MSMLQRKPHLPLFAADSLVWLLVTYELGLSVLGG